MSRLSIFVPGDRDEQDSVGDSLVRAGIDFDLEETEGGFNVEVPNSPDGWKAFDICAGEEE